MTVVNFPALVILFLLCFHLGLTKLYLGESENFEKSVRIEEEVEEDKEFDLTPLAEHVSSEPTSGDNLSRSNTDCESSLKGCFDEGSVEPEPTTDLKYKNPDNREDEDFKSGRVKRYPEHLDPNIPNQLPFYPFWIRVGECPLSSDGARQHYCPTPTATGKWVCIDDYQLCDGMKNCPNAEDESGHYCLFYKALKTEVELLARTIGSFGPTVLDAGEEEGHRSEEMMRPKSSRLSWTVAK